MVCTRTVVQIRTHAQKYFQKIDKERSYSDMSEEPHTHQHASRSRNRAKAPSVDETDYDGSSLGTSSAGVETGRGNRRSGAVGTSAMRIRAPTKAQYVSPCPSPSPTGVMEYPFDSEIAQIDFPPKGLHFPGVWNEGMFPLGDGTCFVNTVTDIEEECLTSSGDESSSLGTSSLGSGAISSFVAGQGVKRQREANAAEQPPTKAANVSGAFDCDIDCFEESFTGAPEMALPLDGTTTQEGGEPIFDEFLPDIDFAF